MKFILAFALIWMIIVIIYQWSEALRRLLGFLEFYLCGLLPTWRMFSPQPVDGDYRLYYRTRAAEGDIFTEWQPMMPAQKGPAIVSLFFHPQAHFIKAMREICAGVCASHSVDGVYYQLMLQQVIAEVLRKEPGAPPEGLEVQFQICWRTPATLQSLFHSHVHPV